MKKRPTLGAHITRIRNKAEVATLKTQCMVLPHVRVAPKTHFVQADKVFGMRPNELHYADIRTNSTIKRLSGPNSNQHLEVGDFEAPPTDA